MRRRIAGFLVGAALASVAVNAQTVSKDPIYRGEYFYNFEYSFLTPDGKNEEWCIDDDMTKAMLPAKPGRQPWGRSRVAVRGKLGPPGKYGGLGRCTRVLKVTEILEVTNMRPE